MHDAEKPILMPRPMVLPAPAVFQLETPIKAVEKDTYQSITNYLSAESSLPNILYNMPAKKDSVSFAATSDLLAHFSPLSFAILFSVIPRRPSTTRQDNPPTNAPIVNCFFAKSFVFHTFTISNSMSFYFPGITTY